VGYTDGVLTIGVSSASV